MSIGIADYKSSSADGKELRGNLYAAAKKPVRSVIGGQVYILKVSVFESFGEDAFAVSRRHSDSPLKKKSRRGFRGYPIATIAFYGPDDTRASKAAVAILNAEGAEPSALHCWFAEEGDVRTDPAIASEILQFVRDHGAKSVVTTDRIIGCPHEEGIDYPEGQVCPQCPFWAPRERWNTAQ